MKVSRDTWLALGLFVLLILITAATALQESQSPEIPYLSTSSLPSGTLALKLWLGELGYSVIEAEPADFLVPQDADLVLILQPLIQISEADWQTIDAWVEDGGSLVLAGDLLPMFPAAEHYDFKMNLLDRPTAELSAQTPLLTSPPLSAAVPFESDFYLRTDRSDFVTHLAVDDRPVLVSFDVGKGRVILSASPVPFSNRALKEDGAGALVLNTIALSVRRGGTWLDDWHHGIQGSSVIGPDQWLRSSSLGRALLYMTAAIFVALILRGRVFGRPIPLSHEIKRRGPLEHVTAIANLNRRAAHRAPVLQQYRHRLKRHLGRRYRLDPTLPDAEYVEALARYNAALDKAALLDLLKRLAAKNTGEAEMVRLAAEASEWMQAHR